MLRVNPLKFCAFGLIFLVTACNSAEASQPTPATEAPAEAVEIEAQIEAPKVDMAEPAMEAAEQPAAMVEEVAPAEAAPLAAAEEVVPATE